MQIIPDVDTQEKIDAVDLFVKSLIEDTTTGVKETFQILENVFDFSKTPDGDNNNNSGKSDEPLVGGNSESDKDSNAGV